jgi:hypothetical protein
LVGPSPNHHPLNVVAARVDATAAEPPAALEAKAEAKCDPRLAQADQAVRNPSGKAAARSDPFDKKAARSSAATDPIAARNALSVQTAVRNEAPGRMLFSRARPGSSGRIFVDRPIARTTVDGVLTQRAGSLAPVTRPTGEIGCSPTAIASIATVRPKMLLPATELIATAWIATGWIEMLSLATASIATVWTARQ